MKIQSNRTSAHVFETEISYFQLVPFLLCGLLILGGWASFISSQSFLSLIPVLVVTLLGSIFIFFLSTKYLFRFDQARNTLRIECRRLFNTSIQELRLDELQDIRIVVNRPVKPPSTKSIELCYKQSPAWKTLGSNMSGAELRRIEEEIIKIKQFLGL